GLARAGAAGRLGVAALPPAQGGVHPDRPARLSADRAFPSYALLGALAAAGWGYYLRQQARALPAGAAAGCWTTYAGAYGAGARAMPGTIPVGRGLVVPPAHQRAAGSRRHRAAR